MTDLRVAALRRVSPEDAGIAFGSGYLVADRLVITAAHVAGSVGEALEVRLGAQLITGTVIWRASGADEPSSPSDAALIEIDDASYRPADLPPVRWGWIVGRGPAVGCIATGYPDSLVAQDGRVEPEQARGQIMPLTRGSDGLVDFLSASWPQPDPDGGTLWSGMSGAAILSDSGHLVIAIIIEIAENFDDRRLTALTVAALRHDCSFTDLVERHTGRPFRLEPVELEEILRPWHRSTRPQSPIALLRSEYEVVPFHGRAQTLGRLVSWCESSGQVSGLLIHAAGGTGKTRLARELAHTMYQKGWIVGELSDVATTFTQFAQLAHPALILIDYAESRVQTTTALLRHIAEHPGQHPVRVLLLARSAGPWWEQLLNDDVVATTLPDEPRELGGLEFAPGSGDQLTVLAHAFDTALRLVPGYEDHQYQTLAFQLPWTLEPASAYHPLTLHIAVLASVLSGPDSGEEASPARVLLRHEKTYWSRLATERSLGFPETRDAALVFGLLCGAHSRQQAALTIGLLPGFRSDSAEDARRALAHWIATLYPPTDPKAAYWGQLAPDWLFEYLLAVTVADEPDLLNNLASLNDDGSRTRLTGAQLNRAVTVLTDAAAHSGEAAATVRRKLIELVAIHNGLFPPYACHISMQAQYPEPLLTALKVLIDHPAAELLHLYQIRSFMPPTGGVLADLGVAVQQRIVTILRASPENGGRDRELAKALNLFSTYLSRVDRIEEATAASGEAVAVYRSSIGGNAEIQDYAYALTNHATNLGRVGNYAKSYQICQEVVDVLDRSDVPPEHRRRLLVGSLNNIFLYHEKNGDTEQACEAVTRAIALQREEIANADAAPHFDLETLAQLLTNQARILEQLERPSESLAAHEESMDIWRGLYRAEPGTYADQFQAQAIRLAKERHTEARHAEAAELYGEAYKALDRLPLRGPERQLHLSFVLQAQAQELSLAHAPFASVVHLLERSCAILGDLFRRDPKISANHYFELLKLFIQGTQLVAEDIDIKPYMAEVPVVLDYIVSQWEAAGHVPGDVATAPNLAMYVSWAIEDGDLTAAIRLCERVEALAPDGPDETALTQEIFQASVMMLRARALARRGDVPEAANVAKTAAEKLADRATPDNHWPAVVAVEGLFDLAMHMSATGAPHESIRLHQAGSAIASQHVANAPDDLTPILANHMVEQARTYMELGEHEAASALLKQTLGYVRGLADDPQQEGHDRFLPFDIRQRPTGPSRYESLDAVLSMYIGELQRLGRAADLLAALAELVDLRRSRWEADKRVDQALSYAWIARIHAKALIDTDQPEAAAAAARTVLAVAKGLPVTDDESQGIRATILHETAIVLVRADAVDDALTSISACIEIYRTEYEPSAKELASSLGDLSTILSAADRMEESFAAGDQALAMWRNLAAHNSDELEGLAIALHNQALNWKKAGREDQARKLHAEFEALLAEVPE